MAGERAIKDAVLYYKNAMQEIAKKFPIPEAELAQSHNKGKSKDNDEYVYPFIYIYSRPTF